MANTMGATNDALDPIAPRIDASRLDAASDTGADLDSAFDADADAETSTSSVGARGEDPEEQAKFALTRARRAIETGSFDDARGALEDARSLDPGNDDIAELERLLAEAELDRRVVE